MDRREYLAIRISGSVGGSFVVLFNVYESKGLESGKSYVAGGSLGALGEDLIFNEDFKIVGFKVSLSKSKNLPKYAFKNILTKAEGHARISISTVRKSQVIFREKRIEDNLKNLQKLYDKEERKITDMGEFIEPDTFFHKHTEKCRLLKIKLKSKEVISFGFFLEEKEARKIIKAIKESKVNYEKFQKEIKEFQKNKKKF